MFWGGNGNDTFIGGSSENRRHGQIGNLPGGSSNDYIAGNLGNDTINGAAGNDYILPGFGDDTVSGGTGTDFVVFTGDSSDITIKRSGNTLEVQDVLDIERKDDVTLTEQPTLTHYSIHRHGSNSVQLDKWQTCEARVSNRNRRSKFA